MENLIPILLFTVALSTLLNLLLKRLGMPTVIGYILAGVVVRAMFGIQLPGNEALEKIAEFGIVFLMFTIGLEFSVTHLRKMKREVFLLGTLQMCVTTTLLAAAGHWLLGLDIRIGVIVGAALALSSTAIVLKLLTESGRINTPVGRNALGILIFQDMAVIPILLMIAIFADTGKNLSELLFATALNALVALAILFVIGKYLLHFLFKAVSNANSKEIYMGMILLTVIGASFIAHHFGFSYSLGGFIAGMMIAETIYKYQVEADLIPFRDLLLGVFFVAIGLHIDLDTVLDHFPAVVGLGLGIIVAKAVCLFAVVALTSERKVALKSAIALAQVGEFALVVFSLLLANQMMDQTSVQILMVITIISMVTTPVLINQSDFITGLLFREAIGERASHQAEILVGHVILCGYGEFGRAVSERLEAKAINHIVLTNNTEAFVKAREAGRTVVFGDAADRALLDQLKIRNAMSVILALDDFDEIRKVSAAITLIDPAIKVIARVRSDEEKQALTGFDHELLLDGNSHTADFVVDQIDRSRLLARETLKLQFLNDYSLASPDEAIAKVQQEQVRLLDIMSRSFNALREKKDILHIKALYDSFSVLGEIIGGAMNGIVKQAGLTPAQYERIGVLLDNQDHLIAMNQALEGLGKELYAMGQYQETRDALSQMAVEGLDAILLLLIDLAHHYDAEDARALAHMTSGRGGLAKIRESYLAAEQGTLDAHAKALLLSATNRMERLRTLFGMVGDNYRKLAESA